MGTRDGRQEERYTFDRDVIVNGSIFTKAVDISMGGMFLKASVPMDEGTRVQLTIVDFDFTLDADVRFSKEGVGAGLKFVIDSQNQWNRMASIIEALTEYSERPAVKRQVLVVDDNGSFRAKVRAFLQDHGYSVAEAPDGLEAIKMMNMYPFHAVLVDLQMDRIDGLKLIGLVRGSPDHKDKPMIVVSSTADAETVKRARRAGANFFLSKTKDLPLKILKALNASFETSPV